MIKVLFFGQLKDLLGTASVKIHAEASQSVSQLLQHIVLENPQWSAELGSEHLLVAVDQVMATPDTNVATTAEVAIFPPLTGG